MDASLDPRVTDYIAGLPPWQQAICQTIREIVHAADPAVTETIKRSTQPYFVLEGNICALLATKDHVNVFVYDPTVADPHGVINQGHGNATARTVQIYRDDDINSAAILDLFRDVVAHNRAGGWRRLATKEVYAAAGTSPGGGRPVGADLVTDGG